MDSTETFADRALEIGGHPKASGKLGIWLFLSGETVLFGGLIGAFLFYRLSDPSWREAAEHTSVAIGSFNTLVLLTSSYTMVMAYKAADLAGVAKSRIWLVLTVLLGLVFLGVKAFEWTTKIEHGITPATGRFWSFYFTMTGLHAVHLFAGVVINAVMAIEAFRGTLPAPARRLEVAGLYWHFVDLVWVFLFPLFYLG